MRGSLVAYACVAAALLSPGPASAQTSAAFHPTRPVTIIVPYSPGGGTDAHITSAQPTLRHSLGPDKNMKEGEG